MRQLYHKVDYNQMVILYFIAWPGKCLVAGRAVCQTNTDVVTRGQLFYRGQMHSGVLTCLMKFRIHDSIEIWSKLRYPFIQYYQIDDIVLKQTGEVFLRLKC